MIVDKFKDFMKGISKDDKVCVMFHGDGDGVCSGVIVSKAVERLREKKIDFIYFQKEFYVTDKLLDFLKENEISKFVVVDIGLRKDNFDRLQKICETLILDHHVSEDLNSRKIIYINSTMIREDLEGIKYPVSKLSFDLCNELVDISDLDWIACAGLISDAAQSKWMDFVREVFERYDIEIIDKLKESELGKIGKYIMSSRIVYIENLRECFWIVYNAKDYRDVLNSKLKSYHEELEGIFDKFLNEFKDKVEKYDGLYIYEIKSKYRLNSPLSSVLSFDYIDRDEMLLVVLDYGSDYYELSARRQDGKVATNELLKKALEGLDGDAGGHKIASGGSVNKKDYEKFKKRLIKNYKNREQTNNKE